MALQVACVHFISHLPVLRTTLTCQWAAGLRVIATQSLAARSRARPPWPRSCAGQPEGRQGRAGPESALPRPGPGRRHRTDKSPVELTNSALWWCNSVTLSPCQLPGRRGVACQCLQSMFKLGTQPRPF